MGDCENILGDWGWLGVIARFSKARSLTYPNLKEKRKKIDVGPGSHTGKTSEQRRFYLYQVIPDTGQGGIIQINGRPYFHYGPLGNTMNKGKQIHHE